MIDLEDMAKIYMFDQKAIYSFVKNIYIKILIMIPENEQNKIKNEINYALTVEIDPYKNIQINPFDNYSYADIRKYYHYLTNLATVTAFSTYVNEIGNKLINNDPIDDIIKYIPEIHAAKYREYIPDADEIFIPENIIDILFEFYHLSGVIQTNLNPMMKYQNIMRSLTDIFYFCPYAYLDYKYINIHKLKLPFSQSHTLNKKLFFEMMFKHLSMYDYKKQLINYYMPRLYNFILSCSKLVFYIDKVLLSDDPIDVYVNICNSISMILNLNQSAYDYVIAYYLSGILQPRLT